MGVREWRRWAATFGLFAAASGLILAMGSYFPKATLTLLMARTLLGLFSFIAAIFAVFAAFRDPPRGVP